MGLERDGEALLKPFCPPYFKSMGEAVQAVVETKFGASGLFRWRRFWQRVGQPCRGEWEGPSHQRGDHRGDHGLLRICLAALRKISRQPAALSDSTFGLSGLPPGCGIFTTKFYQPEVLTESQRRDFKKAGGLITARAKIHKRVARAQHGDESAKLNTTE